MYVEMHKLIFFFYYARFIFIMKLRKNEFDLIWYCFYID